MILALTGLLALITIANVLHWRSSREQRIRWRLYALRDRLRWAAIGDRKLLDSHLFWMLDRTLTRDCRHLDELSVWALLPAIFVTQRRAAEAEELAAQLERELSRPGNELLQSIFKESTDLLMWHLVWRHIMLIALTLVTLIGPILLVMKLKKLATGVVSGALLPTFELESARTRASSFA